MILRVSSMDREVTNIVELINEIREDRTVPRNIREKLGMVRKKVEEKTNLSLSQAIYLLDEINEDLNLPEHTRTDIWHLISIIEGIKEKLKG